MDKKNIGSDFNVHLQDEEIANEVRSKDKSAAGVHDMEKLIATAASQVVTATSSFPKLINVTQSEHAVLKAVLYRDFTSKQAHGGLGPLLSLTPDEAATLIAFLNRIF